MIFASETWAQVEPEFDALGLKSFEETGIGDGRVEYGPDYENLRELGDIVHVVSARENGKLVGYVLSLVVPRHLQYKAKVSQMISIYILPEYRKGLNGYNMLKFYENEMVKRNVDRIDGGFTVSKDLLTLFRRGGWNPSETIYTKWLR